jgi:hypothetical protein
MGKDIMGMLLLVIGLLINAVGGIWLLVTAFRTSLMWGLISLLVPFAAVVYTILHWKEAKKPFLICLACIPFYAGGFWLSVQGAMSEARMQMQQQAQNAQKRPAASQPKSPENRSETVAAPEPIPPSPIPRPSAPQTRRNRSTANPTPAMPPQTKPARMAALNASESPVTTIEPIVKPAAEPVKTPLDTATAVTPPVVEFVSLNNDLGEVIRTIKVRINNPSERAVQKIKVTLTYVDASGRKLKEWTTTHQEPDRIVEGKTIREFNCPAFFMPESTKRVDILLREAGFTDGTQWKK